MKYYYYYRHSSTSYYSQFVRISMYVNNDNTFLLIGWQAYRGDQIHRKNSPTKPRNQIQVRYEKHLPGL